jgi:hypothetical protein
MLKISSIGEAADPTQLPDFESIILKALVANEKHFGECCLANHA